MTRRAVHLVAWQVDAVRRTAVDPRYAGPATVTGLAAGAVCGE